MPLQPIRSFTMNPGSPSRTTSVFRPIEQLNLSSDSCDEPTIAQQSRNKSIFRIPNDDTIMSPPKVARANPIKSDEEMREMEESGGAITPYPLSPSAEELEDREHLIGMNWRDTFEESLLSDNVHERSEPMIMDFSCFFESVPAAIPMEEVDSDAGSFFGDEESIEGFVLEPASPSIWDAIVSFTPKSPEGQVIVSSRLSPSQISVESDIERNPSPLDLNK